MTERTGTCIFAHGYDFIAKIPGRHPHVPVVEELVSDAYVCNIANWADHGAPPPLARHGDCFVIRPGDCEMCSHYTPANYEFGEFQRKRARAIAARRRRKARRAAEVKG